MELLNVQDAQPWVGLTSQNAFKCKNKQCLNPPGPSDPSTAFAFSIRYSRTGSEKPSHDAMPQVAAVPFTKHPDFEPMPAAPSVSEWSPIPVPFQFDLFLVYTLADILRLLDQTFVEPHALLFLMQAFFNTFSRVRGADKLL